MKLADQAAFPKSAFYHSEGGIDPPNEGMTLRHYFSGVALQGLLSAPALYKNPEVKAVEMADKLLNELSKPTTEAQIGGEKK